MNPRGPERPQADWCPLKAASPGLLPAWLGYPGKQKPTLDGLVCTFSLTFAEFKVLSKIILVNLLFEVCTGKRKIKRENLD